MQIKIMSFNIQHCLNFITREIDYDVMADTIKKCGADIPTTISSDHRPHIAIIEL